MHAVASDGALTGEAAAGPVEEPRGNGPCRHPGGACCPFVTAGLARPAVATIPLPVLAPIAFCARTSDAPALAAPSPDLPPPRLS